MNFFNFSKQECDQLTKHINDLKIIPELPRYEFYSNVLLVPNKNFSKHEGNLDYHCFYSHEGERIDSSCIRRGKDGAVLITKSPEFVTLDPSSLTFENRKYIYIGSYVNHYGHFLTEMTSRLWFYLRNREQYPQHLLLYRGDLPSYALQLFDLIGVDTSKLITYDSNTVLKEVIIPSPSFIILSEVHTVHSEIFEKAAMSALRNELPQQTNRILYLSRRLFAKKTGKRAIIGEEEIEDYLIEKGANVEYLENLSLREQIYLINRHRKIIAPVGSALHNLLFLLRKADVFTFSENAINPNYFLIDHLKEIENHYINCLLKDEKCSKQGARVDCILDYKKVIETLELVIE